MSTPTTAKEREQLIRMVEAIRYQLPYPIADTADVAILWDESMTAKNGILGKFSVWSAHKIKLAAHGCYNLDLMVPWLCHELRHMKQFQVMKSLYFIMAIPFLRNHTLEPSAYAVSDAAEKLMEKIS